MKLSTYVFLLLLSITLCRQSVPNVEEFVDYIFCNEKEICALYMTKDLDEAIEKVSKNEQKQRKMLTNM